MLFISIMVNNKCQLSYLTVGIAFSVSSQILLRVLDTHRTHTHTCRVASACGRMSAMQLTF